VTSHFYEFIDPRGDTWLTHELQTGETYEVIVTTAGGLWRYRLGDLVEVDGFVADTPSLRFLGRGNSVSDLCGEKLAETFVTRAIETACAAVGFSTHFAMLAPDAEDTGRWSYALFVEGTAPLELPALLDTELRKNPHYALCRDLGQLGPPRCFGVAGAYERFCRASVATGQRLGDIKPRSLSPRPDWRTNLEATA
jgi:hypothetical protein